MAKVKKQVVKVETAPVRLNPDHSRYQHAASKVKGVVYDNGDEIAVKLRDMTLESLYDFVEARIVKAGRPHIDLRKKYKSLNIGMQRMNLGNILRGLSRVKEQAVKVKAEAKPARVKGKTKAKVIRRKPEIKVLETVATEEPIPTLD